MPDPTPHDRPPSPPRGADTMSGLGRRMLSRDLRKDLGVTLSLLVVLTLSALLMATGALVVERLTAASNELFAQTKPPHVLQMHSGDYDARALEDFAADHPEIESWFIEDMVGVDGSALTWSSATSGESGSMADSLIDNLFVTQNSAFDHLVDEDGTAVQPESGTVYIPVTYALRYDLAAGDTLRVDTGDEDLELTVAGTVRDGQMASSLSSSTRFVVSAEDWGTLSGGSGVTSEIIVEYRLQDTSQIPAFQRAYEAEADLPRNGQAVTITLIRLINVISDGLVAIALVFVSLVLMVIALLNLRFVIRGTLENEVRQIGTMRAIGLPAATISGLYLRRYRILTLLGCVLGGLGSLGATALLTQGIAAHYARAPIGLWSVVAPLAALLAVFVIVMAMCRGVLRSVRRVDVVGALVHGSLLGPAATARRARRRLRAARRTSLASAPGGTVNRRLALLSLRAEARQWVLVPLVFALAAVVVTVPFAVYSTFASPQFITYMGAPDRDIRSDVRFSDDVAGTTQDVVRAMEAMDGVRDVTVTGSVLRQIEGEEGWQTQAVDVGDHAGEGIQYVHGSAPGDEEIALSVLAAEAFRVDVGGEVTLRDGGEGGALTTHVVSGIYQDVTSGGLTAKMQGEAPEDASASTIYADVDEGLDASTVASDLSSQVPDASTIPMAEYVQQTFSSVTGALRSAALIAVAFGIGVAVLITALFLRLRQAQERPRSGVLRALGFSSGEIGGQTRLRTAIVVITGVVLGTLGAALLGPPVVGVVLSAAGLGLTNFAFLTSIPLTWGLLPAVLALAGYLTSLVLTRSSRSDDLSAWLKG